MFTWQQSVCFLGEESHGKMKKHMLHMFHFLAGQLKGTEVSNGLSETFKVLLAFYVFLLKALQPIATSESWLQHKSMGYAETCQKRFISKAISSRPQMFVLTCFTMPCMNPTDDPAAHFHQSANTQMWHRPVIGQGAGGDMHCLGWGGFLVWEHEPASENVAVSVLRPVSAGPIIQERD